MNTFELIEELSRKPNSEIKYALLALMLKDKINFLDLNSAYVEYLKSIKEDRLNQLREAEICVLESFYHKKGTKNEYDIKHTQRCLYLLNQSKRFAIDDLNKKYGYNEEEAKQYSWYERNTDNNYENNGKEIHSNRRVRRQRIRSKVIPH